MNISRKKIEVCLELANMRLSRLDLKTFANKLTKVGIDYRQYLVTAISELESELREIDNAPKGFMTEEEADAIFPIKSEAKE